VIRVLIAATSALVRAGLEALLSASASLVVVGTVNLNSGRDGQHPGLADEIESHEPDVVLVDIESGHDVRPGVPLGMLAPDTIGRAPAFVLLSDALESAWIVDALRGGVRAVLSRDASTCHLLNLLLPGRPRYCGSLPRDWETRWWRHALAFPNIP